MLKVSNFTFLIQKCAFSTHACDKDIILNAFDIVSMHIIGISTYMREKKNLFFNILYRTRTKHVVQMYERIKKELYLNTQITYILYIKCFTYYIFSKCFLLLPSTFCY